MPPVTSRGQGWYDLCVEIEPGTPTGCGSPVTRSGMAPEETGSWPSSVARSRTSRPEHPRLDFPPRIQPTHLSMPRTAGLGSTPTATRWPSRQAQRARCSVATTVACSGPGPVRTAHSWRATPGSPSPRSPIWPALGHRRPAVSPGVQRLLLRTVPLHRRWCRPDVVDGCATPADPGVTDGRSDHGGQRRVRRDQLLRAHRLGRRRPRHDLGVVRNQPSVVVRGLGLHMGDLAHRVERLISVSPNSRLRTVASDSGLRTAQSPTCLPRTRHDWPMPHLRPCR